MEDIMDKEIKNPKTGNMVKVRTALQLPDEHPANKKAKEECLALGFSSETTEYADCNLKLSSLYKEEALEQQKIYLAEQQAKIAQRQANAAKAQAQAAQRQAAESQRRNSNALIKQGQRMMSGACTLGIDC